MSMKTAGDMLRIARLRALLDAETVKETKYGSADIIRLGFLGCVGQVPEWTAAKSHAAVRVGTAETIARHLRLMQRLGYQDDPTEPETPTFTVVSNPFVVDSGLATPVEVTLRQTSDGEQLGKDFRLYKAWHQLPSALKHFSSPDSTQIVFSDPKSHTPVMVTTLGPRELDHPDPAFVEKWGEALTGFATRFPSDYQTKINPQEYQEIANKPMSREDLIAAAGLNLVFRHSLAEIESAL